MDKTNKIDTDDLLKRLEKGVDIWNLSDFHSDLKHAYIYALTLHDMSDEKFIRFTECDFDLGFQMLNNRVYDKFDDDVFVNMAHSELVKYIKWQFYSKIKKIQTAGYRLGDIVYDTGKHGNLKNWCIVLDILNLDDYQLVPQEEAKFDDLVKEIELFIKQCQKETERYNKYENLVYDLREMMEDNDLDTDNVDDMSETAIEIIDQLEKQLAEIKKVVKEHLDDKMRI